MILEKRGKRRGEVRDKAVFSYLECVGGLIYHFKINIALSYWRKNYSCLMLFAGLARAVLIEWMLMVPKAIRKRSAPLMIKSSGPIDER